MSDSVLILSEHIRYYLDFDQWPDGYPYVALDDGNPRKDPSRAELCFYKEKPSKDYYLHHLTCTCAHDIWYWKGEHVSLGWYFPAHKNANLKYFTKEELLSIDYDVCEQKVLDRKKADQKAFFCTMMFIFAIIITVIIYNILM